MIVQFKMQVFINSWKKTRVKLMKSSISFLLQIVYEKVCRLYSAHCNLIEGSAWWKSALEIEL